MFVFRNRSAQRVKVLWYDRDGLAIYYKKQGSVCPHSFAFTGIGGLAQNLLGRPAAVGGMDRIPPFNRPRRCTLSPDAALIAPPRARLPFGRWRSINSGAC
jgi:hypothetical protein